MKFKVTLGLSMISFFLFSGVSYSHYLGYSAVDNFHIVWTTDGSYPVARDHAVFVWNDLGGILFSKNTSNDSQYPDLDFNGTYVSSASWDGLYDHDSWNADEIFLNGYYMNGYDYHDKAAVATHEVGHALGLDHSYKPNIMYECSTCTGNNTPQSHDKEDYYNLWW